MTPLKNASPSKQSLKSVKEHKKTPYSKIKDPSAEDVEESVLQTIQPNFNKEIIGSARKSRGVTPKKNNSEKKIQASKSRAKSRSKSPLGKIKEEFADASEKKEEKSEESKPEESKPEESKPEEEATADLVETLEDVNQHLISHAENVTDTNPADEKESEPSDE